MDFHQLMKQAAANQAVTEKRFEKHQLQKEKEDTKKKLLEEEKKKKAKEKLREHETKVIKSRLAYKGLLSSSGEPLTDTIKQYLPTSSKTSTPSNISTSNYSKHTTNSNSKLLQPKVTSTKSKSTSPRPLDSSSKTSPSSDSSSNNNKHIKGLPKKSTGSSKSQTPPPRLKDSKKGPVNFQDLLKIAQKNSKKEESKDITPSVKDGKSDVKGTPGHVGIGRALLDKQRKEEKTAFANKKLDKADIRPEVRQEISSEKKGHSSYNGRNNDTQQKPKKVEPSSSTSKVKINPYTNTIINRPQQSSTASSAKVPTVTNTSDEGIKNKPYPYPPIPNRGGMPRPATARGGMPRPPTARGGVARPVSARGRGTHTFKSNSFYGTPASARLITDSHSRGSSRGAPMSYRSTWVDEMRDYMQHASAYYDDEEEDEELDDFVVDDDEYDEEIEVGSAIRDIFGYDKNQYHLRDEEDDRIMESSFAQQEFEERRSERIGLMEDAEEMRKEQEELLRKRKRGSGRGGTTKKFK